MSSLPEPEHVTKYQFQIEDDTWETWKNTVPRSKSLETRIIELIEADREGAVLDDDARARLMRKKRPEESFNDAIHRLLGEPVRDDAHADDLAASVRAQLNDADDETADAVVACVEYLRDAGGASPKDFRENVFPDHPAGSTNEDWWWSKKIRPLVEGLDEVDYVNQRTIRYAG